MTTSVRLWEATCPGYMESDNHHPLLQIYPIWGIFLPDLKPVSQCHSRMQARGMNLRALLGPLKVLHYGQSPTQNFCNFPPDKSSTPICINCTFNIGPKTSYCLSQDSNIIKYSSSKGSEVCLPTRVRLLIL